MKSLNIKNIAEMINMVFRKFHLTIFIVIFVVGLATAVIMLTNVFNDSNPDHTTTSNTPSTVSNQQIIDKIIEQDTNPPYSLPAGRVNPFSE